MATRGTTKKELIPRVRRNMGAKSVDDEMIRKVISAYEQEIADAMGNGERVVLMGFGVFERRTTKARFHHNFITGKKQVSPSKDRVHFKPGAMLKRAVGVRVK